MLRALVIASTAAIEGRAVHPARGLLDVDLVGSDDRLGRRRVETEERAVGARLLFAARRAVLLAGCGLKFGEAFEAERLAEAHDGRRRSLDLRRELLGRLEGRLLEVVDDVERDVALGARAAVEVAADQLAERQRLGSAAWRGLAKSCSP